jgi:tetratricopeptide (TPR) repeat protein
VQSTPPLTVTIQLSDVSPGTVRYSQEYEAAANESVFDLIDRISSDVKDRLSLETAAYTESDPAIADVTTHSREAYMYYVEGNKCFRNYYYEDAVANYRKALEYDSTFAFLYYCLAWFGEYDLIHKAVHYSDKATEKERLYIRSLEAAIKGDTGRAVTILEDAVRLFPEEKEAWYDLALYAMKQSDQERAIRLFHHALELDPLYGIAYDRLAQIYTDRGDLDSALWAARRRIRSAPERPAGWLTKGMVFARSGGLDSAIASFARVCSIKPDFGQYSTMAMLGRLYAEQKQFDSARVCFERALRDAPQWLRSTVRIDLGILEVYRGKVGRALQVLNDGIAADHLESIGMQPGKGLALKHKLRAALFAQIGEKDSAIHEFEAILAKSDELSGADTRTLQQHFITLQAQLGEFARANELLEQVGNGYPDLPPDSAGYWLAKGHLDFHLGNYRESEQLFARVCSGSPDFFSRHMLARCHLELGRFEEAIEGFQALLQNYASYARYIGCLQSIKNHYYLARACQLNGQVEAAVGEYRTFVNWWGDADPRLQSLVADARDRIRRLTSES